LWKFSGGIHATQILSSGVSPQVSFHIEDAEHIDKDQHKGTKNMKKIIQSSVVAFAIVAFFAVHTPSAKADDSAMTKTENAASDAKTATKKTARKGARKVRKAAGTDTAGKDMKDSANNAKDSMDNSAQKMKNKANNN
jgi:hypothetical protein